jgi:hypothetical protein
MWALSVPVDAHCASNWDRPDTDHRGHHYRHRGAGQQAPGERRRDREDEHQHTDDREHRVDELTEGLLEGLLQVVHVVGDQAEHLPGRIAVQVGQWQPGQLRRHRLAQAVHHPLDDRHHQPPLHEDQQRRGQVHDEGGQQHHADATEVDAPPRNQGHGSEDPGEGVAVLGAQVRDHLRLGQAGVELLAERPSDDQVGGPAEDPRTVRGECRDTGAEQAYRGDREALRAQQPQQAAAGAAGGLRGRLEHVLGPPGVFRAVLQLRHRPGRPPHRAEDVGPLAAGGSTRRRHQAASCSVSCDRVISR